MTTDPENTPAKPENAAEGLPEEPRRRFDPFTNEGDMFKIVLGAGGAVLAVAIVAVLLNAVL
jgi:hypothetical protein